MCVNGVNHETITSIFNAAVRPVLMYGLQCVYQTKKAKTDMDKMQSKLLKSALGLNSFCKTSPLIDALKINRITTSIEIQELCLLKSMFLSKSRTRYFYKNLLQEHLNGSIPGQKDLLSRVNITCLKHNISLVRYLCDADYARLQKHLVTRFPINDGVIDSVRHLLNFKNPHSKIMLNLLLSPF